jgi:DNA-binding transcriptional regulator of glucitol operon
MTVLVVLVLVCFLAAVVARWWQVRGFGTEPAYRTEDDPTWLAYWIDRL